MIFRIILAAGLLCALQTLASAARLGEEETFAQVSSNAGDCATCEVRVTSVTRDIILLEASNDWVGIAAYDEASDSYRGHLQWDVGRGGNNEGVLFQLVLRANPQGTLAITATSAKSKIEASYRKKDGTKP